MHRFAHNNQHKTCNHAKSGNASPYHILVPRQHGSRPPISDERSGGEPARQIMRSGDPREGLRESNQLRNTLGERNPKRADVTNMTCEEQNHDDQGAVWPTFA